MLSFLLISSLILLFVWLSAHVMLLENSFKTCQFSKSALFVMAQDFIMGLEPLQGWRARNSGSWSQSAEFQPENGTKSESGRLQIRGIFGETKSYTNNLSLLDNHTCNFFSGRTHVKIEFNPGLFTFTANLASIVDDF